MSAAPHNLSHVKLWVIKSLVSSLRQHTCRSPAGMGTVIKFLHLSIEETSQSEISWATASLPVSDNVTSSPDKEFMSIAMTPYLCGLETLSLIAPRLVSHTMSTESTPASPVTTIDASEEWVTHVIGLVWPWSTVCSLPSRPYITQCLVCLSCSHKSKLRSRGHTWITAVFEETKKIFSPDLLDRFTTQLRIGESPCANARFRTLSFSNISAGSPSHKLNTAADRQNTFTCPCSRCCSSSSVGLRTRNRAQFQREHSGGLFSDR